VESDTNGSGPFRSLRDVAADELRDRIIEGELPPGARLVERDLGEQLDVSRIVIRESIQQLAAEGLVVILPRRGAQVVAVDPVTVEELFELRISLESMAAGAAAQRRTEADLARFAALMDEAREAVRVQDAKRAAHLNMDFHRAVIEATGNRLLLSVFGSLSGQALRLFRIGQDLDARGMHDEHVDLVEAIRERQAKRASKLMADHIIATRADTLKRIRAAAR